jgi:hypothetical protein
VLALAGVAAIPLVAILILVSFFTYCDYQDRAQWGTKPFTQADWLAAGRDTRHIYANNLLSSSKLAGLTPQEVRVLLGPPDNENPEHFSYRMKAQDCGVDYWLLDIRFYRGRVNDFYLSSD